MSFSFNSHGNTGDLHHRIVGHNEMVRVPNADPDGPPTIMVPEGGYALDEAPGPAGLMQKVIRFAIFWQKGPIDREKEGATANGAFVEDVLDVCQRRLEFYQDSAFACDANAQAIQHIKSAIKVLLERRADRAARGVLGKNAV